MVAILTEMRWNINMVIFFLFSSRGGERLEPVGGGRWQRKGKGVGG
jgi:hypothetical protein